MRNNALKKSIELGDPVIGCSIMIPSPEIVEMLAAIGFDWVLIDCEHGSISMESVEHMTRAAEACGITAIARPRKNDPHDIMLLMERGVMGVQVPYIDTAEDARTAVSAVKFGKEGTRRLSVGTRPHGYGFLGPQESFKHLSNQETMVIAQIESIEAVNNLPEILEVPGVDVFFIGPSDLSQSMGFTGQSLEPKLLETINGALSKIRKAGKIAGMPSGMENAPQLLQSGIQYIHAHLCWVVGHGGKAFLQMCKNHKAAA